MSGGRSPAIQFQSTLPAKGETEEIRKSGSRIRDFNPLSPRRERQLIYLVSESLCNISIHSPREGRDLHIIFGKLAILYFNPLSPRRERLLVSGGRSPAIQFQSTLPAKGETPVFRLNCYHAIISIHSPREGRDPVIAYRRGFLNPFQSTLPAKGETRSMATRVHI